MRNWRLVLTCTRSCNQFVAELLLQTRSLSPNSEPFPERHTLGKEWDYKWDVWISCCCCCSVVQSCLTLCNPMNCSTPGFPVLHHLSEFAQIRVHWVNNTIQPSHPLSPLSPPALHLSQHQGLFQWHPVLINKIFSTHLWGMGWSLDLPRPNNNNNKTAYSHTHTGSLPRG